MDIEQNGQRWKFTGNKEEIRLLGHFLWDAKYGTEMPFPREFEGLTEVEVTTVTTREKEMKRYDQAAQEAHRRDWMGQ